MNPSQRKTLLLFTIIISALTLFYLPSLIVPYVHHDSYRFLDKLPGKMPLHSLFNILIHCGRPLAAVLMTIISWFVHSLNSLNALRFLSLAQLGFSALILMIFLRNWLEDTRLALLGVIALFTLPSFQSIVAYAANAPLATAILLSCLTALHINQRVEENPSFFKKYINPSFLLEVFLLISALCIHQTAAMFYWVIVFLCFLCRETTPHEKLKEQIKMLFIAGFLAIGLYALLINIIPLNSSTGLPKTYNPHFLTINYIGKFFWFLREPLPNALNLWNIFPNPTVTIAVLLISFSPLILFYSHHIVPSQRALTQSGTKTHPANTIMWIFVLGVLSFLPNLVSAGKAPWYRCLAGLSSIMLLSVFWGIKKAVFLFPEQLQKRILTGIFAGICLYGGLSCYHTVLRYRVLPSFIEFQYISYILNKKPHSLNGKIVVTYPPKNPRETRYDEFGVITTHFPSNIFPMITYIQTLGLPKKTLEKNNQLNLDMKRLYNKKGEPIWLGREK